MTEYEALLARMLERVREDERPALRQRIRETAQGAEPVGAGGDETGGLRFLQDLDIFLSMPGPDFMYSRGIAETLRVGEDIFELAYVLRRAQG
jgi:hypothetical protein